MSAARCSSHLPLQITRQQQQLNYCAKEKNTTQMEVNRWKILLSSPLCGPTAGMCAFLLFPPLSPFFGFAIFICRQADLLTSSKSGSEQDGKRGQRKR